MTDNIAKLLYSNVNQGNLRYELIREEAHVTPIRNMKLHVIPHLVGVPSLLVFGDDGVHVVSKKSISRKENPLEISAVSNLKFKDLTILDGRLIRSKYYIQDVHVLNGHKCTQPYMDRLNNLKKEVPNLCKAVAIILPKVYTLSQIPEIVVAPSPEGTVVNGIIFMPHQYGKHYIFLDQPTFTSKKMPSRDQAPKKEVSIKQPTSLSEEPHALIKVLTINKTDTIDVYELYNEDTFVGIACVDTLEHSQWLRKLFNGTNTKLLKCEWNEQFSKYKPVREAL